MPTLQKFTHDEITTATAFSRREAFARALGGALVATAGAALLAKAAHAQAAVTDADILNFALNLEYLEASYYTYGATGLGLEQVGIPVTGVGTPGGVTVRANPLVPFDDDSARQFANEVAVDEQLHIKFLRSNLGGAAVARPQIDLLNSFNAAAQAAGVGPSFDPFASQTNFLLGAFALSDVGVTAYKGSARLIQNKSILSAAAGILATEAYHVSSVRVRLLQSGQQAAQIAQALSDLRDTLDGPGDDDQGITLNGTANVVPTDGNGLVFGRTAQKVLNIVYSNPAAGVAAGGFFPSGVNGTIHTT